MMRLNALTISLQQKMKYQKQILMCNRCIWKKSLPYRFIIIMTIIYKFVSNMFMK